MPTSALRSIIVTEQHVLGSTKAGAPIYEVIATTAEGNPIDLPLRAFTELVTGEAIEVEVKPFDSDRHGRSYTIYPKRKSSKTTKTIESLEEQLADVTRRLEDLESAIVAMKALSEDDDR